MIDASTVFDAHRRVQAAARAYTGGMYWKRQGDYEYLVKTQADNRQARIGPRSPETEATLADFGTRKTALESRLQSLRGALTDAEPMNKALKAGRTPALVVRLLQTLDAAGLARHFTVVGTHALYAYETAAGVRIMQGAMATMHTIAPGTLVAFKRWMAEAAPQHPDPKRRRDARQADIVAALMDQGLLPVTGEPCACAEAWRCRGRRTF